MSARSPANEKKLPWFDDIEMVVDLWAQVDHGQVPTLAWFTVTEELMRRLLASAAACNHLGAEQIRLPATAGFTDAPGYLPTETAWVFEVTSDSMRLASLAHEGHDGCDTPWLPLSALTASLGGFHHQHEDLSALGDVEAKEPQWYGGALLWNQYDWSEFMENLAHHRPDIRSKHLESTMRKVVPVGSSSACSTDAQEPHKTRRRNRTL